VGLPVQQTVTRFLEATGNTAPVKSVDLVARVQGVLQSIDYKDGTLVKERRHAVHDRARNLQAETGASPGGRGRRAGVSQAG
jgi:multidrug efflux pump subunit AcrA (membrane-fusion protein)